MGRGGADKQPGAGTPRRETLVEGTPYTEAELLRWADRVLERLLARRPAELLAVRVANPRQLPAVEALRLLGQHRGLDVVLLVAGYTSPARVAELRRRGALLAHLPGDPPAPTETPLDALDVARAAGEPQEVGEELPWPDPERAGREHPELSPQIAWRRLALSELAALG
mgnify:CR=1 FL=1